MRGNPKRRDATRGPLAKHVEPTAAYSFLDRDALGTFVWRKIARVIRQGSAEHGQDELWCVEWNDAVFDDGRSVTMKRMTWVRFDADRGEWVDGLLYRLERGIP